MEYRAFSRYKVTFLILLAYVLPVLYFSLSHPDSSESWFMLGSGLLVSACGAFLFFWLLISWENALPVQELSAEQSEPVQALAEPSQEWIKEQSALKHELEEVKKSLSESETLRLDLLQQLEAKNGEMVKLAAERQEFEQLADDLHHGYSQQRLKLLDEMDKQRQQIAEHHQTILEQRDALERKQQQLTQLENKVRDLNYELKTILKITEKPIAALDMTPAPPRPSPKHEELRPFVDTVVQTDDEAALQLKRCLDIAQGMTGASHYGVNSRFREFSAGHYALDQRRLFDRLRTEDASTIFVYSLQDNKMLFVNDQVKLLLGLSAERFIQGFLEIATPGLESWNEAMRQLTFKNEVHIQLPLKNRLGEEIVVDCMLGIVPTGLFRNQIIGVLFTPALHLHERSKSI